MCGRYASFRLAEDLADEFDIGVIDPEARALAPSWNLAPTQPIRIVTQREVGERALRVATWGLVPVWAKDPVVGARMINARIETADFKPAYRTAMASRRCLVPAEGYYEWQRSTLPRAGGKVPHYIHAEDDAPLALAGLYEFWRDRSKTHDDPRRWLVTAAIVTTAATGKLAHLHARMPLLLDRHTRDIWLDRSNSPQEARDAALAATATPLQWYPVDTAVNSARNNGPELLTPAIGNPTTASRQ